MVSLSNIESLYPRALAANGAQTLGRATRSAEGVSDGVATQQRTKPVKVLAKRRCGFSMGARPQ